MKVIFSIIFFIVIGNSIFSQNLIPESIKSDLTLKPQAKPYESKGFDVEKGATLTILPGTKIIMTAKPGDKNKFPIINVYGTLVIGSKGAESSKPVVIECTELNHGPWLLFESAKMDINGLDLINGHTKFSGNNSGILRNCSFTQSTTSYMYPFQVTVPTKDNLTIQNCLIENQGLELKTNDFPNDLDKFTLIKCAFTTKWMPNEKKFKQFYLPMNTFAYGTECDCYTDITFKAFDWVLSKKLETKWHIGDERIRKTTEDAVKLCKTFSMKLPSKPFTGFIQEKAPDKEIKKK